MKKICLLAIITIVGFAGCQTKTSTMNPDTMNATAKAVNPAGNPSSQITPPQTASSPITVTTRSGLNPDTITFSVVFMGPDSQAVSIKSGPVGNSASFNNRAKSFGIIRMLAPDITGNITVSSTVNGNSYSFVTNEPIQSGPNTIGINITRLATTSDTVVIVIQDDALLNL